MESTASTPSTAREFQDTASPAVVSLYRVVPALIATNDGGATPVKPARLTHRWASTRIYIKNIKYRKIECLTEKGADKENPQRHVDDRGSDVDEPVGKKGGYSQEDDVID